MKHTQGEWEQYGNGVFKKDKSDNIAVITLTGDKDETLANAKLIAAAPELLERLKWAYNKIHRIEKLIPLKDSFNLAHPKGLSDYNEFVNGMCAIENVINKVES